ncbi:MAG: flagellar biosynthetic protein FliO [Heliobacteriaceae bacterium]|nr:flagellar biosynthetic protein FliO [Heliobacteriaceae bacterium]
MYVIRRFGRRAVGGLAFFGGLLLMILVVAQPVAGDQTTNFQDRPYQQTVGWEDKSANLPETKDLILRLGITVLVLGLAGYAMVRCRRYLRQPVTEGNWLAVIDQTNLGPNKDLYITEVAGKFLVIGVTDHAIQPIIEITDPQILAELRRVKATGPVIREKPGFGVLLNGMKNCWRSHPAGDKPNLSFHATMNSQLAKLDRLGSSDSPENKGQGEGEERR